MSTFVDASYVSPLVSGNYYLYSVWKNFASLREASVQPQRHTPCTVYSVPKKVLVASLLEGKLPRPTDTLDFCTLDTVERADKFAAEMFALGIEVLALNEFDYNKIPYCDAIRLRAVSEPGEPDPDWYQVLLTLNKWAWNSHRRQEITNHPDHLNVVWFND